MNPWDYLVLYLPLGVIGAWRWGAWVLRVLIGLRYRAKPLSSSQGLSVSVVIPVYGETPEHFQRVLAAVSANSPREIIAVIDHQETGCIEAFEEFQQRTPHVTTILSVIDVPGKRPALHRGVEQATGEIIALVDADTVWAADFLAHAVAPFEDPAIQGVTVRQEAWNPQNVWERLQNIFWTYRYTVEMRFLSGAGFAVSCLSGRTALYRRAILNEIIPEMLNETFWGRPVVSGEDKFLTEVVQKRGGKTFYQASAVVYARASANPGTLMKQRLRWSRNSWRSDLRAFGEGWVWRRKALAFHLADRAFAPFTVMLGFMFFAVALAIGHWPLAIALTIWWTLSRPLKVAPHFWRHPKDLLLVPLFVVATFISAVLKIHALVTLHHMSWLTRWSPERLSVFKPAGFWARALPYCLYGLTAGVLGLLAFSVAVWKLM